MRVNNAIIMAAGTSSRFAPLSYESHKALISVKGEILIERQIKQLKTAGVDDIIIVTGYKAEQFEYLKGKYNVKLIHNPYYLSRNNNASIYVAREFLSNSYVCSADNYFAINPFEEDVADSYYAALYSQGYTNEWCMEEDENGFIASVKIGGSDAWYMLGHTFWSDSFSKEFIRILDDEFEKDETKNKLWESIFLEHLDVLKMKIRKYQSDSIFEFDSLDELREFDNTYIENTGSKIMQDIAAMLNVSQRDIKSIKAKKSLDLSASGITFECNGRNYSYDYNSRAIEEE